MTTEGWYDVHLERGVTMSAADGVALVMDVYRPARGARPVPGRFPALVERTPYDRANARIVLAARHYARHGYAVVLQDVRGRGDSGGSFGHLMNRPDEGEDGRDTLAWVVAQPWCDGAVGTFGGSFTAANQQSTALHHPPGLRAQVLRDCGTDYYRRFFRWGGAFALAGTLCFCVKQARLAPGVRDDPGAREALARMDAELASWIEKLIDAPAALAPGASPLRFAPEYEAIFWRAMTEADDSEFWRTPTARLAERFDRYPRDVAVLMISGWYGNHCAASFDKFHALGRRLERAVRLVVGPWVHGPGMGEDTEAGGVEFGLAATEHGPNLDLRRRWFDRFVRGVDNGVDREPPLALFVMGTGDGHRTAAGRLFHGGYWRGADAWPLPGTRLEALHLHRGGRLAAAPPEADAPPSEYDYDPREPCPSIGGLAHERGAPSVVLVGGQDQRDRPGFRASRGRDRPLAERPDVLAFESGPLACDLTVIGPIEVVLYVASSAPDTDFVAKLVDVYPPSRDFPDGFALLLAEGIVRMRYRDGSGVASPIAPGEVYEVAIDVPPTGNVFKAGHRVRLDVTSACFPEYDANPNTGEPLGRHTRTAVAHQRVFHDGRRPSRLVLPVQAG